MKGGAFEILCLFFCGADDDVFGLFFQIHYSESVLEVFFQIEPLLKFETGFAHRKITDAIQPERFQFLIFCVQGDEIPPVFGFFERHGVDFSGCDALVFVFEMLKLDNSFVPDGEKKVIEVMYPSWGTIFQVDELCKIRLGVHGVHDLERFYQALVVLVHFRYGAVFYVVSVIAFLFVMDIKIEKIRYVLDISLQCTDGVAPDLGILKLEGVEKIALQLGISGRRALQSFDDQGVSGKVKIFFHWGYLMFFHCQTEQEFHL